MFTEKGVNRWSKSKKDGIGWNRVETGRQKGRKKVEKEVEIGRKG